MANSDFTVYNMGATIHGTKNDNGTYTIKTQGSKKGAEETTSIVSQEKLFEQYPELETAPVKDTFIKSKPSEDNSFSIHNIGATIYGQKNDDGTYTIITKGSLKGAKPEIKVIDEQEFQEKYADLIKNQDKKQNEIYLKSQDNEKSTLQELLDNDPFSFLTSPVVGGIRIINPGILMAAGFTDISQYMNGLISGDKEKQQEAIDSLKKSGEFMNPGIKMIEDYIEDKKEE